MMVAYSPMPRSISFIWAMKTVPTDTKRAVPSILTVAPMGSTKREIRGSTPHLSFMQRKVMGSVAALWKEEELVCHRGVWAEVEHWSVILTQTASVLSVHEGWPWTWPRLPTDTLHGDRRYLQELANMIIVTHPLRPGTGTISETNK